MKSHLRLTSALALSMAALCGGAEARQIPADYEIDAAPSVKTSHSDGHIIVAGNSSSNSNSNSSSNSNSNSSSNSNSNSNSSSNSNSNSSSNSNSNSNSGSGRWRWNR